MIPAHVTTAPGTRGDTTVMLVVGVAGQALGGGGVGFAVRAEHQETDHTTLGVELGAGRGDKAQIGERTLHHYLVAVRGYGRWASPDHDWVDATYGLGFSVMRTGLVTATVHAGGGVAYPNRYLAPTLHAGLALALPLVDGTPYGDAMVVPGLGAEHPAIPAAPPSLATPGTRLFLYADGGVVVPIERATISPELGFAAPLNGDSGAGIVGLSLASGVRVNR